MGGADSSWLGFGTNCVFCLDMLMQKCHCLGVFFGRGGGARDCVRLNLTWKEVFQRRTKLKFIDRFPCSFRYEILIFRHIRKFFM